MKLYAAVFDRYKFRRLVDGTGSYCNEGLIHFSRDAVPDSRSVAW